MRNKDLKSIIDPISEEVFFRDYYAKKFLHIKRSDNKFYDQLLTLEDVDKILTTQNHIPIRIVKQKQVVPPELYGTGKDLMAMIEYFNNGASIVFDRLEATWEPLRQLCWNVYKELGTCKDIFANVYYTPPSSQAFKIHMDWQENFILQVKGEKVWNLFEGEIMLPVTDAQSKIFVKGIDETKKTQTITLKEGDLLYVPRGLAHEVMTSDKQSLHITFTVIPMTKYDVGFQMLGMASEVVKDLRTEIDRDFYKNPKANFKQIIAALQSVSDSDLERFAEHIRWLYETNTNASNLKNYFLDHYKMANENAEGLTYTLRKDISINFIRLNDSSYRIQMKHSDFNIDVANEEIEFIMKGSSFKVSELPGELELENKTELLKGLVSSGILTVS